MKYLNLDGDHKVAYEHADIWAERGIGLDRFDTMTGAIQKLLTEQDYLFIAINGDSVDFMPLLSTMRSVTHLPILIVSGSFTTAKQVAALKAGADLYGEWHPTPQDNIDCVLAYVERFEQRSKMKLPATKVMVFKDMLVSPAQRSLFIGSNKTDLTRKEFDLLYYLMVNHGKVLSYKQIYRRVWGLGYEESKHSYLHNFVHKLRDKIVQAGGNGDCIKTEHHTGYSFSL